MTPEELKKQKQYENRILKTIETIKRKVESNEPLSENEMRFMREMKQKRASYALKNRPPVIQTAKERRRNRRRK